eukprot:g28474.t1
MAKPPGVWDGVKTKQPPPRLKVSGCTHSAVRAIICGDYLPEAKSNHEKPVYRKVDGKQVLLYFWDARHGTEQMGWWFGPEIGGEKARRSADEVWKLPRGAPQRGRAGPASGPPRGSAKIRLRPCPNTVVPEASCIPKGTASVCPPAMARA